MEQEWVEVVSVWVKIKTTTTVKEMESYASYVAEMTNSCKAWCMLKVVF